MAQSSTVILRPGNRIMDSRKKLGFVLVPLILTPECADTYFLSQIYWGGKETNSQALKWLLWGRREFNLSWRSQNLRSNTRLLSTVLQCMFN